MLPEPWQSTGLRLEDDGVRQLVLEHGGQCMRAFERGVSVVRCKPNGAQPATHLPAALGADNECCSKADKGSQRSRILYCPTFALSGVTRLAGVRPLDGGVRRRGTK